MIKIKSMCVALNLFCFGHFFPIPKISTPAKVIVAAIHSARATAAKLEIMDGFAFDDISTFFASDCVSSNSRHNQSLFSAFLIFSAVRMKMQRWTAYYRGQHLIQYIAVLFAIIAYYDDKRKVTINLHRNVSCRITIHLGQVNKKRMKDRAKSVKVELPHNNLTKGGHILHGQEYNTGHGVQAILNEIRGEIRRQPCQ